MNSSTGSAASAGAQKRKDDVAHFLKVFMPDGVFIDRIKEKFACGHNATMHGVTTRLCEQFRFKGQSSFYNMSEY